MRGEKKKYHKENGTIKYHSTHLQKHKGCKYEFHLLFKVICKFVPQGTPCYHNHKINYPLGVSCGLNRNFLRLIVLELFAGVCLDNNRCCHVGQWQDIKYCKDELKLQVFGKLWEMFRTVFFFQNVHITIVLEHLCRDVLLCEPTCWGLCRDCSEPGWLALWWWGRTRTLVELVLTQTAVPQTEDWGPRCLLIRASLLPSQESEED